MGGRLILIHSTTPALPMVMVGAVAKGAVTSIAMTQLLGSPVPTAVSSRRFRGTRTSTFPNATKHRWGALLGRHGQPLQAGRNPGKAPLQLPA